MKLARVDHYRCDDIAASTFVWAPDEMTAEQFGADVRRAREAFLAAGAEAAAHVGPRPQNAWPSGLETEPDEMTVGEWRARRERQLAEWAEWESKRRAASRPFGAFLADLGYLPFYDFEPGLAAEVDWGHRHGQDLDLDDTTPSSRDLRGMLRTRSKQVAGRPTTLIVQESYVVEDPTDQEPRTGDPG